MVQKIVIQGIEGSFHYQAAKEYFETDNVDIVSCNSFDRLANAIATQRANTGIMALENSIAGSILPNYTLIDKLDLQIVGEHYIDIQQNLMALTGQDITDIKEVHSHPMALLQCKSFFHNYPEIKLVEDTDTASTAKRIHEKQLRGIAAIASKSAAELYELNILAHSIQAIKINSTRFVVLKNKKDKINKENINKASLKFQVYDKSGSLATVLNVISDCRINMTKIQSLPVVETPWKYAFFVDIVFEAYSDYEKVIKLLSIMTENLKILGEYKNALK